MKITAAICLFLVSSTLALPTPIKRDVVDAKDSYILNDVDVAKDVEAAKNFKNVANVGSIDSFKKFSPRDVVDAKDAYILNDLDVAKNVQAVKNLENVANVVSIDSFKKFSPRDVVDAKDSTILNGVDVAKSVEAAKNFKNVANVGSIDSFKKVFRRREGGLAKADSASAMNNAADVHEDTAGDKLMHTSNAMADGALENLLRRKRTVRRTSGSGTQRASEFSEETATTLGKMQASKKEDQKLKDLLGPYNRFPVNHKD
jgi:hypothetical protein